MQSAEQFAIEGDRGRKAAIRAVKHYARTPLDRLLAARSGDEDSLGEPVPPSVGASAVSLFHGAAELVPAYGEFLQEKGVRASSIITYEEFVKNVPLTDKANYLAKYRLPQRCIGGQLCAGDVDFLHVSSGSTGEPTFWARSVVSEVSVAARFEQVLCDAFGCNKRRTLAVIAFPLGSWVGGVFTTFCMRYMAIKGHPITCVTPGNNIQDILRCVQSLSPMFDRTAILGYPPFVKGVIDAGVEAGVSWKDYNLCMVLAGEVFSEEWRALVASRAGIEEPLRDIASVYGTADAGVIGNETPLSASIRLFLSTRPETVKRLFGTERLPTLVQYDPAVRLLETTEEGTIVVTAVDGAPVPDENEEDIYEEGDSESARAASEEVHKLTGTWPSPTIVAQTIALHRSVSFKGAHTTHTGGLMVGPPPLVRYHIGDAGGVITFDTLLKQLEEEGFDLPAALPEGLSLPYRRLPFCWVLGRAHWAVSLYGANVFVDQVVVGLEQGGVCECVTGKFILSVCEDTDSNPRVKLDVELVKGGGGEGKEEMIAGSVKEQLCRLSSEYRSYVPAHAQAPLVVLHPFGDPKHFPVGVKHKWTK